MRMYRKTHIKAYKISFSMFQRLTPCNSLEALRLYLVWDSESIENEEDRTLEQIFESVDQDSDDESSEDRKHNKKRKRTKDTKASSVTSDGGSSHSSEAGWHSLVLQITANVIAYNLIYVFSSDWKEYSFVMQY